MHHLNSTVRSFLVTLGLFLLVTSASFAGVLRGEVTDAEGNPLTGVRVEMIPVAGDVQTVVAKSNKKGKFVFGLLRPADYRLVAFSDGLRIARIDANLATPNDDSLWSYHEDVPPGTEMPTFNVTGLTEIDFDIQMKPAEGGPGEYGTGLPVSPTKAIIALIQQGETDQAEDEIRRSLEANPDAPALHYLQAFLLRSQNQADAALAAVDRAIELDPAMEGTHVLQAKILEDLGRDDDALVAFQAELDVATSTQVQTEAVQGLAGIYLKTERTDEAKQALQQLIELTPDAVGAYQELANIYILEGDEDKAREMLDQVSKMGGDNPDILYNMGATRYNSGDLPAAREFFEKTIAADPEYTGAYLQLGFTCLGLDDREAAARYLKKFLELSPDDDPNVETATAILQQIAP